MTMKPKLEVLKKVVGIVVTHHTAEDEWYSYIDVDAATLHTSDEIHIDDNKIGSIKVIEITSDNIVLCIDGQYLTAKLGETTEGRATLLPNSPDREEIKTSVSYSEWTLYNVTIHEIMEIGEIHARKEATIYPETTEREQVVINNLDKLIALERVCLYPLKALLMASNNWNHLNIVRLGLYQIILLEGIEKGALAPDDEVGWSWMHTAAINNNPTYFMTDMDRYYDLLMSAVENGNEDALEIMNQIWEPENCQEED